MKQTTLLFVLAAIVFTLLTEQVSARIWRVNNASNYNGTTLFGEYLGGSATNPVFSQINDAIKWNPLKNGDTLHVEGSAAVYGDADISKKLVIIGPGYFLGENPNVSTNINSASISSITFNTGSETSQVLGMNVISNGVGNSATIYVNVNGIIIKRCRIEKAVQFGSGIDDVYIIQSFFITSQNTTALITNGSGGFVPPTTIVFNNNICQKTLSWAGPITQCNNNVFDGPPNTLNLQFSTAEFRNNILKPLNATVNINTGTNQNVTYNTGTSANQFGTAAGNTVVINISTIFVAPTAQSTDGRYQLVPGTDPGSDGTERGVFGGAGAPNRYTLSGLPNIPTIYSVKITGPAGPSGLPVTIQARTIK